MRITVPTSLTLAPLLLLSSHSSRASAFSFSYSHSAHNPAHRDLPRAILDAPLIDRRGRAVELAVLAAQGANVNSSGVGMDDWYAMEERALCEAAEEPVFAVYWDRWIAGQTGLPDTTALGGFNHVLLSFWLRTGPADQAAMWTQLTAEQRQSFKQQYLKNGVKLMVSAFGSTDTPTSSGANATAVAGQLAQFVKEYGFDGADVDYEDFAAIGKADGSAENWVVEFTTELRAQLPKGQYTITHAPVAPWFSPIYKAGAYTKIFQKAGDLIDYFLVQFYNQGATEYTTCEGLLDKSSATFPSTSLFEIHTVAGVPLEKLVIGKPATTADASTGYMSADQIGQCVAQAVQKGWKAGVSTWQWDPPSGWLSSARGGAL